MIIKKVLIAASAITMALAACNSDSDKGSTEAEGAKKEAGTESEVDITKHPDYQPGLDVIGKSDCLTCHRPYEKIQGPTYHDVAVRYADSARATIVPSLAKKVIEGGVGVWGEIPMTPHPGLTQEEAEAAVKYVLLLKKPKS